MLSYKIENEEMGFLNEIIEIKKSTLTKKKKNFAKFFNLKVVTEGVRMYKSGKMVVSVVIPKVQAEEYVLADFAVRLESGHYKMKYNATEIREFIKETYDGVCQYCGETGGTIDHILPKAKGGLTILQNLTLACIACNEAKADENIDIFLKNKKSV